MVKENHNLHELLRQWMRWRNSILTRRHARRLRRRGRGLQRRQGRGLPRSGHSRLARNDYHLEIQYSFLGVDLGMGMTD
ncbi:unnamed protein product [Cuscuta campestris]|uniref:Uncharacterized protein n=1 Tax=Cuscuta campestris TaxID=132261 RepID=A0A484MR95_9ASTE|nr:unnamed protein product [Cuscuta campestris]